MIWVGVDVGGTFTDVVVYDESRGNLTSGKSPSTPEDTAAGVLRGLAAMGVRLTEVSRFRHGATVATNTALERAGARLGVITTAGHRDVLIVGRGNRSKLYDIKAVREPSLVRRSHVLEIPERISADGSILRPLDEHAVAGAAQALKHMQVEAIAICFLHSYANPAHERRAAEIVAEVLPDCPVSCSSSVLPEQREFERFATTALNAYVAPRMARYLARLKGELSKHGLAAAPEIMTSGGGSWTFERMTQLPVNSMLSGPAAGVIGAVDFASKLGVQNIITYDMGGTSTDTCLVRNGHYELAAEGRIGGLPNRAAQIEINTVGAGGGSIAYLNEGGFLHVGPRSAGAIPGPACYGRGGIEPTVTDANVVLGRFRATSPLGGEITIDDNAACSAVDNLANALSMQRMASAEGILRIAVTRMTGAVKEISVMRGIDPRDFTLFAFGGAGPLHAADIAAELGIRQVIIPPMPGAFSAYGLLVADRRRDASITRVMNVQDTTFEAIEAVFKPMREQALADFKAEGFDHQEIRFERSIDMRFAGQAFELNTPVLDTARTIDDVVGAFLRVYEERYSHADKGVVEAVSFRLAAYANTSKPRVPSAERTGTLAEARTGTRAVHFAGHTVDTPIYERDAIPPGEAIPGPAIIDEPGSSTVVPPGFRAERHESSALILTREAS